MREITVLIVLASCLYGRTSKDSATGRSFQILRHNANNIELCISNYGKFGQDETGGNAGLWWPRGTNHTYVYGAGLWFGAQDSVTGDTLVTIGYGPHGGEAEFAPGRSGWSVSNPQAIIYMYPTIWPPYDPLSLPMAPEKSRSHQDSWCVYNDSDITYHIAGDTRPIGLEVYQTVYVWNLSALWDAIFITYEIKNVLGQYLKDLYFGMCADNDIGNESSTANDWLSGIVGQWYVIDGDSFYIDDLAYQWQEAEEPGTPPWFPGVIGYDLMRTPYDIVQGADKDNDGILDQYERDSAYYVNNLPPSQWDIDGDILPDWRDPSEIPNLGMTALKRFTLNLEPSVDHERYMTLAGYNFVTGAYEPYDTFPWCGPDDQRFLQCSGPFELMPDSTVTVVLGIVLAKWFEVWLSSDTALVLVDYWAQYCHDMNWFIPGPPPSPGLTLIPGDAKVTLVWDNISETTRDPWFELVGTNPASPIYDPFYRQYDFEGYRVWRSLTRQEDSWELLASCDLANGIQFEDTTEVDSLRLRATDTGIFHSFTDNDVRNGFPYYYAVTAFDWNQVKRIVGLDTSPTALWFESGLGGDSVRPRRDPANYVPPGEPVIEWVSGNDQLVELVGAAVAYPQQIDPAYALYIEYGAPEPAVISFMNTAGDTVRYTAGKYTAYLKDDAGILDTIVYTLDIGAGYVPHEVVPPVNGMFINPDIGTPVIPGMLTVFDTITVVTGTYPYTFLSYDVGVPLPAAALPTDTVYMHGMWAWRGNDYQVVWHPKNAGGPVNTIEVTDLVTGDVIPYQQFQNNPATVALGAGWCFTWHTPSTAWSKPSHDTIQTLGAVAERTRYLYINGGMIALRNNSYMYDTIRPQDGETWILRANRDYLPPSVYGAVKITGTPGVFTDTAMTLNVKVVPNPYIIWNEWQTQFVQRRLKFINLPNRCTIRIFNLNGELVRTLFHNDTSEGGVGNNLGGDEWWNVLSENRQLIASGVYIFHIESDIGEQVGKFVIVN